MFVCLARGKISQTYYSMFSGHLLGYEPSPSKLVVVVGGGLGGGPVSPACSRLPGNN